MQKRGSFRTPKVSISSLANTYDDSTQNPTPVVYPSLLEDVPKLIIRAYRYIVALISYCLLNFVIRVIIALDLIRIDKIKNNFGLYTSSTPSKNSSVINESDSSVARFDADTKTYRLPYTLEGRSTVWTLIVPLRDAEISAKNDFYMVRCNDKGNEEDDRNDEKIILSAMGPARNFHGFKLKPVDFGLEKFEMVNTSTFEWSVFENKNMAETSL